MLDLILEYAGTCSVLQERLWMFALSFTAAFGGWIVLFGRRENVPFSLEQLGLGREKFHVGITF